MSLPQRPIGIALLWGIDELPRVYDPEGTQDVLDDFRQAFELAMGTEISRELRTEDGESIPVSGVPLVLRQCHRIIEP